jgi:hypothetical protein
MKEMIDGGGGGGVYQAQPRVPNAEKSSPRPSVPSPVEPATEASIARRLGCPFFGFFLYHSGHPRIQRFLARHLTFLDNACGSHFALFSIVEEHEHPLRIDEMPLQMNDPQLLAEIRRWRSRSVPFTPDRSFVAAENLGLSGDDLPCIVIFRSSGQRRQSFAILRMKDSWFPDPDSSARKPMATQVRWLLRFTSVFKEAAAMDDQRQALAMVQQRIDSLARQQRYGKLKDALVPIATLPYNVLESLPRIIENVASKKLASSDG